VLFFASYFGIASRYLWPGHEWLMVNGGPAMVLIALAGGFLFTERVLGVRHSQPRLGAALQAGSVLSALAALAFAGGLIGYRDAQTIASALGPFPMLLAVPAAYQGSRNGDRVSRLVLVGWSIYALSTLVVVGLLRGLLPSNFWTLHTFQFGSLFEMFVWLHVLGLRMDEVRQSAQRATLERDALRTLAHTDPLTGLPNRRGLNDALGPVLRECSPTRMVAVYLLDLDGFKPVNDRFGHDVGDALLVEVGRRLKENLRASDTVARLGGDEFVVMASGLTGDAEARRLGGKLLDAFAQPFDIGDHRCSVGITIGYALAPLDGQDGPSLLKRADAAMYAGKQAGRHCLRRGGASAGLVSS
jgi:diguanylate cyclase